MSERGALKNLCPRMGGRGGEGGGREIIPRKPGSKLFSSEHYLSILILIDDCTLILLMLMLRIALTATFQQARLGTLSRHIMSIDQELSPLLTANISS